MSEKFSQKYTNLTKRFLYGILPGKFLTYSITYDNLGTKFMIIVIDVTKCIPSRPVCHKSSHISNHHSPLNA